MSLQVLKEYNGRKIRIRPSDRYVSLTDMAKAAGKRFNNWNRLESTKSYLNTLSSVTQIGATELIQVFQGGDPEKQGTWGHPKVALRFAQWCSDDFAVQVDFWIDELMTKGQVSLNGSQQPASDRDLPDNLKALQLLLDNAAEMHRKQQELERRQQELETQQREQSLAVTEILEDKRIATEQLKALPAPTVEAPDLSARAKVNQLVRNYVGRTNVSHREAWRRLYKEFFYRCSYNAGERAKRRKLQKLDCIEQDGLMEKLYAVGCKVFAI